MKWLEQQQENNTAQLLSLKIYIEAMQQRNRIEDVGKPREKVCRGSPREVWIDKFQRGGWQTVDGVQLTPPPGRDQPRPAGAAVEGSRPACREIGVCRPDMAVWGKKSVW
ncbi:hypothetical protein LAZ67_1001672 [Cordylochernes scorpioides]|uniref:Uncharacterized protein n=1 Tax=Cordylochernes scorpioides TaxID=51811 RepID=A0ABY6JYY0_9ARAC|nr:hypothetical protein LAZ67_1001672 [Cordylochernes scorpioides]